MALTCQNCGSTDVVTIQGQNFCINCGQMVKGKAPKSDGPLEIQVAAVEPVKVSLAPKKANTQAVVVKAGAARVIPRDNLAKAEGRIPGKVVNPPKKARKAEAPSTAIIPHIAPTPYETKKGGEATVVEAGSIVSRAPSARRPHPTAQRTRPVAPLDLSKKSSAASREPEPEEREDYFEVIKPHPLSFTLKVVALVAVPIGIVTGGLVGLNVNQDIAWYWVAALLLLFGTTSLLAQAALLYGLSRNQDHRPTHPQQWWAAARSGFIEVINVDLATLLVVVIAGFGWVSVAHLGNSLSSQPQALRWAVLGLANLILAWMTLGALAARHIAIPAVVIGGVTSTRAIMLGWKAYLRAGGHLILALIETAVARLAVILLLLTLALVAGRYTQNLSLPVIAVASGFGAAVVASSLLMLLLQVEVRVWLKQYRFWVNLYFPGQKLRLLSGRTHSHGRR
jgi:hypothetical protein